MFQPLWSNVIAYTRYIMEDFCQKDPEINVSPDQKAPSPCNLCVYVCLCPCVCLVCEKNIYLKCILCLYKNTKMNFLELYIVMRYYIFFS